MLCLGQLRHIRPYIPSLLALRPASCRLVQIPLACLSVVLMVQVTLSSDAVTNQAACEDAGGTFTAGLEIDADDAMMAQFVVPTDGSLPTDGAVDVVLKAASGVEDTALGGFTFDSTRPANLIDDAMTRPLSTTPLTGKTDIAQNVTRLLMMPVCRWLRGPHNRPFVAYGILPPASRHCSVCRWN